MTDAVLIPEFRKSFPELDESVSDVDIKAAGRVARDIVPGTETQFLYAVAHLTQAKMADIAGDTTSLSVGGISRSFKTVSKTESDVFWSTTFYGRTYLTLVRQTPETGAGVLAIL